MRNDSLPEEKKEEESKEAEPMPGQITVAFEKLFGGGRGVQKFARSGLRYVKLGKDTILIEQNPTKRSEWARLAKEGRRIAWLMREGEYLARVVDGETTWLVDNG
jgi:hypothetical protein